MGNRCKAAGERLEHHGSSPRTWGTGPIPVQRTGYLWFIPTHVGNSPCASCRRWLQPVHPHARGEQFSSGMMARTVGGSSPRTWGTAVSHANEGRERRFIPTHVGNSRRRRACRRAWAVHPHARGEQSASAISGSMSFGSSPRTWGTGGLRSSAATCSSVHPTHVGNSPWRGAHGNTPAVHPHARGEQLFWCPSTRFLSGSSPRTWGTGSVAHQPDLQQRFIPTHVGNRCTQAFSAGQREGSSPRTWGTGKCKQSIQFLCRFIPTHVGNRSIRPAQPTPTAVHPHARGEQAAP